MQFNYLLCHEENFNFKYLHEKWKKKKKIALWYKDKDCKLFIQQMFIKVEHCPLQQSVYNL
jgi:hypothetical protein